jgi:4-hydroxythreonine-4-phosphate dehydrogenase
LTNQKLIIQLVKNKPILIVAGEPYSVFFEIFFKSIKKEIYKSPLILICCKKNLMIQMKKFNFNKKIQILDLKKLDKKKIDNNKINLINVELHNSNIKKLKLKLKSNYIEKCFNLAFQLIRNGYTNKLINGPINKKTFLNKKYLGVTEYIASKFKKKKIGMLIYNKKLSVSPLTTHLPLKLVSKKITKKLIDEKITIINTFFKKKLMLNPKIAVAGLNPHCESIDKFNEDEKIVSLAIKSLIKKKINVKGPYPADTIFLKANRNKFDVILGMYHDQVLTPIKTLFEYDAINVTMGLPFLRVTPDHGPNEKMFGQNKSNPLSLIQSLKFLDKK